MDLGVLGIGEWGQNFGMERAGVGNDGGVFWDEMFWDWERVGKRGEKLGNGEKIWEKWRKTWGKKWEKNPQENGGKNLGKGGEKTWEKGKKTWENGNGKMGIKREFGNPGMATEFLEFPRTQLLLFPIFRGSRERRSHGPRWEGQQGLGIWEFVGILENVGIWGIGGV